MRPKKKNENAINNQCFFDSHFKKKISTNPTKKEEEKKKKKRNEKRRRDRMCIEIYAHTINFIFLCFLSLFFLI